MYIDVVSVCLFIYTMYRIFMLQFFAKLISVYTAKYDAYMYTSNAKSVLVKQIESHSNRRTLAHTIAQAPQKL